MAAPNGNQFWKLRTEHGRKKLFETPEILWEEACKYFEWVDENPFYKVEQARGAKTKKKVEVGENGMNVEDTGLAEIPVMRAYTWEGLEIFLDITSLRAYKTDENYKDFQQVITRIGKIIYNQKFTGAASGFLNSNIIARDLGLTDKQDHTSDGDKMTTPIITIKEK